MLDVGELQDESAPQAGNDSARSETAQDSASSGLNSAGNGSRGDDRHIPDGEHEPGRAALPSRKRGGQPGNLNNLRHGLHSLESSNAKKLKYRAHRIRAEIRDSLIADLGGEQNLSAQQRVLVEFVSYDVAAFDQVRRAIERIVRKK